MTKDITDIGRCGGIALGRKMFCGIVLAVALLIAPTCALVEPAHAAENSISAAGGDGRLVRIGLNKSIVIKLPGEARDVLVGNPDIVDAVVRTKNTAYLFARAIGQTNIFFFDANGQQILALDLEVTQDKAALQKLVRRTIPGSRIVVDTIGDNVVLSGTAKSPADAKLAFDLAVRFTGDEKKVISSIGVLGKEQVMLKVRIAEVQRNVLKQFGINTTAIFSIGKFAFDLANINPFTSAPISLLGGYGAGWSSGGDSVDVFVRAMERDGLLRTLAEPTLTAVSGEAANFLAGGEFPIPVAQDNDTITVEFKKFGVGLGFTPLVLSEGRISLKISTEVSEISNDISVTVDRITVPGLSVRRAETTVELPSGGSLAMAGLIKDSARADITGTPGLKNLPILGALFRSRDFQQNQTELVVIVTPYVVNPVNEQQLAMPTDGLKNATDKQAILFGRLNKIYGTPGKGPNGVYHGNVGYIVE
ncbi:type II and III secretion system protein family protein [Nordella sp. HKS 07]|uniref:type II and III secretion system protein family protein n=1 Tax=Nordella sp. HKS 07 TaxID=2712222 RepID=UPI0013E10466|nr:type II and III secretion system protein family protein [Nordella sp. HKS 07]QIG48834.1 type II and III secretion system protein family protein [Nordella sp. HKS 07]